MGLVLKSRFGWVTVNMDIFSSLRFCVFMLICFDLFSHSLRFCPLFSLGYFSQHWYFHGYSYTWCYVFFMVKTYVRIRWKSCLSLIAFVVYASVKLTIFLCTSCINCRYHIYSNKYPWVLYFQNLSSVIVC